MILWKNTNKKLFPKCRYMQCKLFNLFVKNIYKYIKSHMYIPTSHMSIKLFTGISGKDSNTGISPVIY